MLSNLSENIIHQPVLVEEVIKYLEPQKGQRYLDLTAGFGGHATEILKITKNYQEAVLVDRDPQAVEYLKQKFTKIKTNIMLGDFLSLSQNLLDKGSQFDIILADLGVSSLHLNEVKRGFSFQSEAPLDMRMDSRQSLNAKKIVNSYTERELKRILKDYADEPKATKMAQLIIASRPIETTSQLADIAKKVWPGRSKVHPATRLFQAIRIEVNDELNQLRNSLNIWLKLLAVHGRLAVISFHSIEDREVKRALTSVTGYLDSNFSLITPKPIIAKDIEIAHNPRSRSAKLRVVVKQK